MPGEGTIQKWEGEPVNIKTTLTGGPYEGVSDVTFVFTYAEEGGQSFQDPQPVEGGGVAVSTWCPPVRADGPIYYPVSFHIETGGKAITGDHDI